MKILGKILLIIIGIQLVIMYTTVHANPFLVCDKYPYTDPVTGSVGGTPTHFGIEIIDISTNEVISSFKFNYQVQDFNGEELAIVADLVNFPAGENKMLVWAENEWDASTKVPFTFNKQLPGVSTGLAIVNIDGVAYLITDPQDSITHYRIIIDGVEYVYDSETDGSLRISLEGLSDGAHSIELYSINIWGESNLAPFEFTKRIPNAPRNIILIP